jgi:phytol kinase
MLRAFAPLIPAPGVVVSVVPIAAVYGALAAYTVGYLHTSRGVPTPYTRKLFHFAIFTMAGLIHLIWSTAGVVVYGSVVAGIVVWALLKGDGHPFYEALARPSDRPRRTLFIVVPLATTAVGGVCANLVSPSLAFVGYLVCGWGDAVGEPVGTRWGVHRYRVPSIAGVAATRSLEGSGAVLVAGSLAAFFGLWVSGQPLPTAAYIGTAAGVAGAAVESISNHGLDNFTVQVTAAAVAVWLLR